MNDEEIKAIEHLKKVAEERTITPLADEIATVLNLIEKKDMIIDKLASFIFNEHYKMTYVDEEQFKERKREIIENTLKIK